MLRAGSTVEQSISREPACTEENTPSDPWIRNKGLEKEKKNFYVRYMLYHIIQVNLAIMFFGEYSISTPQTKNLHQKEESLSLNSHSIC